MYHFINNYFHTYLFFLIFFAFSRADPTAYGGSRLGVESELLLPAYARATTMRDPSLVFDLHHSSRQHGILNPLSEAGDRTRNLMVPNQICYPLSHEGNSNYFHIYL